MPVSRKGLCLVYGVIALLALAGTWGNNVHYLHLAVLAVIAIGYAAASLYV